ncbi:hypothetical protein EVAR_43528_1 [Eumeta japonica]|uniref:Uncharacterized protein n=1 Tax=Eumeta variegata TaxID=151549 RepID=A0A4C1WCH7_EUMVA|nr:hypothetical protein EVAR_43528_1 [Eumeta japonica]
MIRGQGFGSSATRTRVSGRLFIVYSASSRSDSTSGLERSRYSARAVSSPPPCRGNLTVSTTARGGIRKLCCTAIPACGRASVACASCPRASSRFAATAPRPASPFYTRPARAARRVAPSAVLRERSTSAEHSCGHRGCKLQAFLARPPRLLREFGHILPGSLTLSDFPITRVSPRSGAVEPLSLSNPFIWPRGGGDGVKAAPRRKQPGDGLTSPLSTRTAWRNHHLCSFRTRIGGPSCAEGAYAPSPASKRSSPANAPYPGSHTQSYGHSPTAIILRCVKCLGDHGTAQCTRNKDTDGPPACVPCKQKGHTATFDARVLQRDPPPERPCRACARSLGGIQLCSSGGWTVTPRRRNFAIR